MELSAIKKVSFLPLKLFKARTKLSLRGEKISGDILGNVAVLKFGRDVKIRDKRRAAREFLENNKSVTTVLEKVEKFSGRLRTQKTKFLAGENTKEVLYKENGCVFRFNVESCYFSPRLSSERKELADMVRKNERVLVMFGGVAPFAVVIGKKIKSLGKNNVMGKVVSVELGRECNKYALQNVKRNRLEDFVEIVQGDVRRVLGKGKKVSSEFDRIIMARPNLKDSFLDVAFSLIKKGGLIHYYGFYEVSEVDSFPPARPVRGGKLKELIDREAKKAKRKVKILKIKKAGDIGPYKFRYRVDFRVLS